MSDFDGLGMFRNSVARISPEAGQPLDAEQIASARAAFPEGYADMLAEYGFGSFAARKFQFLDPAPFAPIIAQLFAGDPQIDPARIHVTGCEAFGEFTLWSQQVFKMGIDIHKMHLTCPELTPPKDEPFMPPHLRKAPNPAAQADLNNRARLLLPFEPKRVDFWDVMGKPLFATAKKTLGALEAGEIYAFEPPLVALNGALPRDPFERMVRCSAVEALQAAAEVSGLSLVERVRGQMVEVRKVGAPD